MYQHLDQSWRQQPAIMSEDVLRQFGNQLATYVQEVALQRIIVIFHGGEPLLATTVKLIEASEIIRQSLPSTVQVDFTIQTNGVLLTRVDVEQFAKNNIQVSISLDGPAWLNDRHRPDHKGRSSFQKTMNAITLLQQYPTVYAGLIAVIDADSQPEEMLSFFSVLNPPSLDFLLPDANYSTLPKNRDTNPDLYKEWLLRCFDVWFDSYSHLRIRTFEAILNGLMGLPSETDAFGLGDVSMLTLETDGTYHDLDVLKITGEGTSLNIGNVFTTSISQAANSAALQKHRSLLTKEGLCQKCQECRWVELCGGGAVPHRHSSEGFNNPSIYCTEIMALIEHAQQRVEQQLAAELDEACDTGVELSTEDLRIYDQEENRNHLVKSVHEQWQQSQLPLLDQALLVTQQHGSEEEQAVAAQLLTFPQQIRAHLSIQPSIVVWTDLILKKGRNITVQSIDGQAIKVDYSYIHQALLLTNSSSGIKIHRPDVYLRLPFGEKIIFEPSLNAVEKELVEEAFQLIGKWNPALLDEIYTLSPEIQFIIDPTAHVDKVVSFSDNSVPGSLYIQLKRGNGSLISVYDLADSIIHEHRHQKLYLLQRISPIMKRDFPLVPSPWREELRPPTGLFHAIFVFVKLYEYWQYLRDTHVAEVRQQAEMECQMILQKLSIGFETVYSCPLTTAGNQLLTILEQRIHHEYAHN